jgi:hypothetical protein
MYMIVELLVLGTHKKLNGKLQVWVQFPHCTTRGEGDDMVDFGRWMVGRERMFSQEVEGDEGGAVVEDLGDWT